MDILGDDEPNLHTGSSLEREAHAAFSIEGTMYQADQIILLFSYPYLWKCNSLISLIVQQGNRNYIFQYQDCKLPVCAACQIFFWVLYVSGLVEYLQKHAIRSKRKFSQHAISWVCADQIKTDQQQPAWFSLVTSVLEYKLHD